LLGEQSRNGVDDKDREKDQKVDDSRHGVLR